jgi:tetratricopeptide (TPR) repeat protein
VGAYILWFLAMKVLVLIIFLLLMLLSIAAVFVLVTGVLRRIRRSRAKEEKLQDEKKAYDKPKKYHRMLAEYYGGLKKTSDRKLGLLFDKGLNLKKKGKLQSAIKTFQQCLKENLPPKQQAGLLVTTGNCYFAVNQLQAAEDCYQRAGRISAESNDPNGKLSSLINLGFVSAAHERWDNAISIFHQAVGLDQKLAHVSGEAIDLNTLGLFYENKGDLESAMVHYTASLLIFKKLNDKGKTDLVEKNIQRIEDSGKVKGIKT